MPREHKNYRSPVAWAIINRLESLIRDKIKRLSQKGASEELNYENPLRDLISTNRIKMWELGGLNSFAEIKPLLAEIPVSFIIEVGSFCLNHG